MKKTIAIIGLMLCISVSIFAAEKSAADAAKALMIEQTKQIDAQIKDKQADIKELKKEIIAAKEGFERGGKKKYDRNGKQKNTREYKISKIETKISNAEAEIDRLQRRKIAILQGVAADDSGRAASRKKTVR